MNGGCWRVRAVSLRRRRVRTTASRGATVPWIFSSALTGRRPGAATELDRGRDRGFGTLVRGSSQASIDLAKTRETCVRARERVMRARHVLSWLWRRSAVRGRRPRAALPAVPLDRHVVRHAERAPMVLPSSYAPRLNCAPYIALPPRSSMASATEPTAHAKSSRGGGGAGRVCLAAPETNPAGLVPYRALCASSHRSQRQLARTTAWLCLMQIAARRSQLSNRSPPIKSQSRIITMKAYALWLVLSMAGAKLTDDRCDPTERDDAMCLQGTASATRGAARASAPDRDQRLRHETSRRGRAATEKVPDEPGRVPVTGCCYAPGAEPATYMDEYDGLCVLIIIYLVCSAMVGIVGCVCAKQRRPLGGPDLGRSAGCRPVVSDIEATTIANPLLPAETPSAPPAPSRRRRRPRHRGSRCSRIQRRSPTRRRRSSIRTDDEAHA